MICKDCKGLAVLPAGGFCTQCSAGTTSMSYMLCPACSKKLLLCELCCDPVEPSEVQNLPTPQPANVFFVRKYERDNGGTTSLRPGEQLLIELPEERFAKEWTVDEYPYSILSLDDRGQFTPDPGDYQHGTRTIVFTASRPGQGVIKLGQETRYGGSHTLASWTITVKVK